MIHSTAIVDPKAQLDSSVEVGPYAIIGPDVKIEEGCIIHAHAYLSGHTTLRKKVEVFPFACVGMKTQDLKYREGDVSYVDVGEGTVLREYSSVHLGTRKDEVTKIGQECLVMAYCHVAHGCNLGNHIIMSNAVQLAGEVRVEDYAIIGGLTGVHQFCRIGTYSMVGGGSSIRQDCPPFMITETNENGTEVRGPNIVGLQRHGFSREVRTALKDAYRILYREGLNRSQALERIVYEVQELPEIQQLVAFYRASSRGVC